MVRHLRFLAAGLAAACLCGAAQAAASLQPYRSEAEFTGALQRWRDAARALQAREVRRMAGSASPVPAPAPMVMAAPAAAPATVADAGRAAQEGITNVQTAGVDEGGIVKRAGDFLVVLRRGRLFTVRVANGALAPVAQVDAFAPGSDGRGAWYDELLVSGRTVVVVGFSHARGGTEIGLFDLSPQGGLRWKSTHHLRSHDYFSARNYASRLVGQQLVFYTPLVLSPWGGPWAGQMPALRPWTPSAVPEDFERILPATRIHRTDDEFDPRQGLALHTVTRCALDRTPLRCESDAVLGPVGRVFYVSQQAVYVWTQGRPMAGAVDASAVFRLPLDGAAPQGLKAVGAPVDALSFLEDGQGMLNVLLREQGAGEGMWSARRGGGRMALLRVPLSRFGDGREAATQEHYRKLPGTAAGEVQNRYVGDWLLWGSGSEAWAVPWAQGGDPVALAPGHPVERIEALGSHALLVGNRGPDLVFSGVDLHARRPAIEGRHVQAGSRQAESRTHGFFFRPTGRGEGLLGLPVHAGAEGAAVVVLRTRDLAFTGLGELASSGGAPRDDACVASCVDWYGNARPIFLGERVLALMGYEIVEGRLDGRGARERIVEVARVDFSPAGRRGARGRPTPFD